MMYLMTREGVLPVPKKKGIKSLYCRHKNQISGLDCSESGLLRISGSDQYRVCNDCGKILEEHHTQY